VAGGSCQEMEPAVDFSPRLRGSARPAEAAKLAGPKRPFLPPTGGTFTAQGRAWWLLRRVGSGVLQSRGRGTRARSAQQYFTHAAIAGPVPTLAFACRRSSASRPRECSFARGAEKCGRGLSPPLRLRREVPATAMRTRIHAPFAAPPPPSQVAVEPDAPQRPLGAGGRAIADLVLAAPHGAQRPIGAAERGHETRACASRPKLAARPWIRGSAE
jgi:hypothetical protein